MSRASQGRPQGRRTAPLAAALAVVVGLAAPAGASAADRLVNTGTGTDAGSCLAVSCKTVAYGLGQSVPGDRVLVAPGTYTEQVTVGAGRTLIGTGASRPVIDGGAQTAVTVNGAGAQVTGLRLRGDNHGLLIFGAATTALVTDNVFDDPAVNIDGKVSITTGAATLSGNQFISTAASGSTRALISTSAQPVDIGHNDFADFFESVRFTGAPATPPVIHDNTISGVRGNGQFIGSGIWVYGDVLISDNVIGAAPLPTPLPPNSPIAFGITSRDVGVPVVPATVRTARNRIFGFTVAGIDAEFSSPASRFIAAGDVLSRNGQGYKLFGGDPHLTGVTAYDNGYADVAVNNATLTVASSIIGPAGVEANNGATCAITDSRGPMAGSAGCGDFQTSADPAFAGPGDYRLTAGSPLVDAGAIAAPAAGEVDLAGTARAVVGLAAGACAAPRRDMGAYEFTPPVAIVCPPPPVVDPPPGTPPPVVTPPVTPHAAALTVLGDAGRTVKVSVDGARASSLAAGAVGKRVTLSAATHTVRLTARGTKAVTARVVLKPGRLAALVVTRSRGRLRARVVSVGAGSRRLVSLVPGTLRVRIGGAKTAKLRHGAFATVVAGAARVTVGKVKVALPAGAQLTVLTRHGRRILGVARAA